MAWSGQATAAVAGQLERLVRRLKSPLLSSTKANTMEDLTIHMLARADVSTGKVTTAEGTQLDMVKLHLWVFRHGEGADNTSHQLPPVWMDPTAAATLMQGIAAKLHDAFPERVKVDLNAAGRSQH